MYVVLMLMMMIQRNTQFSYKDNNAPTLTNKNGFIQLNEEGERERERKKSKNKKKVNIH